jgi:hypothetical protein
MMLEYSMYNLEASNIKFGNLQQASMLMLVQILQMNMRSLSTSLAFALQQLLQMI